MTLDEQTFNKMIKNKARTHTRESFKYFWTAFIFHLVLYGVFAHFFIKHFDDTLTMAACVVGILAYVPFTVVLIKKFKALAVLKDASIQSYVQKQYDLLDSFYRFKKRYELVLLPVFNLVGTYLLFELTVPGGSREHLTGAIAVYVFAMILMIAAWKWENEKSFDRPLSKLRTILNDLNA